MRSTSLMTLIFLSALLSCTKPASTTSTSTTTPCGIDTSKLINIVWNPIGDTSFLATLRFASGGNYYENGTQEGVWNNKNKCDSIFVDRPVNWDFTFRILSVTTDTLKIANPTLGNMTYYK